MKEDLIMNENELRGKLRLEIGLFSYGNEIDSLLDMWMMC